MKLVLSSRDFRSPRVRQVIQDALGMPMEQCRVLFIPNEKGTAAAIASGKYHARLAEFGFRREHIAVFDHTRAAEFEQLPIDAVYVSGGNTFWMLQMLRGCGFDRALARYVREGAVYIGGSAGAHLVTADVAHVRAFDEPPEGMRDFRGLGLTDCRLVCHATPERRALRDRLAAESGCPVYALGDDDYLLIET